MKKGDKIAFEETYHVLGEGRTGYITHQGEVVGVGKMWVTYRRWYQADNTFLDGWCRVRTDEKSLRKVVEFIR